MTHIVKRYFDAFNAGDTDAMLACLSDDVTHHVNEGGIRTGKLMGWMAPASTGVAMRQTAGVDICL